MRALRKLSVGVLLLATLAVSFTGNANSATINIINMDAPGVGLNDATPATTIGGNPGTTIGAQRLNVFNAAAKYWEDHLQSTVPINVEASFASLACNAITGVLGSCGPKSVFRSFNGALFANTWYVPALANALYGADLDPAGNDIQARFNKDIGTSSCLTTSRWYYGLDHNPPSRQIDFLNIALHEFAHGLGFLTFVDLASGTKMMGYDDAFMRYLKDFTTSKTYPNMTDAERVAASKNTGNLYWVGPNVTANSSFLSAGKSSSGDVQMYGPNPQQPGSSVSHFSDVLSPDDLMEPSANATMDPRLTIQAFKDIGWNLAEGPLYVAPSGNDSGNTCTNQLLPCKTIQHALDVSKNGDTIMVAEGRYIETITLKAGVKLSGKGAGKSIIDANKDAYDFSTGKGPGSVITAIGTDITNAVVVSGFTITGGSGRTQDSFNGGGIYLANGASPIISNNTITGNVSGTWDTKGHGGAIYVANATPVIENNIIENNASRVPGAVVGGNGCGIYVQDSNGVIIQKNTIQGNQGMGAGSDNTSSGGGIYTINSSNTMITDNTIMNNIVHNDGGGLALISCLNCTLVNNTIKSNKAYYGKGGGILITQSPNLVMTNNTISNNENVEAYEGGGIHLSNSENIAIKKNVIAENRAHGIGNCKGGGVFISQATFTFSNNEINKNSAYSGTGAGIYVIDSHNSSLTDNIINGNNANGMGGGYGGGLAFLNSIDIVIANNIITNNGAGNINGSGGGIAVHESNLIIVSNTIMRNRSSYGGGISNGGGLTIYNNIITENSAEGDIGSTGGGIYSEGRTVTGDYNNVWGNTACGGCNPNRPHYPDSNVPLGAHGISANPLFVNADGGDYHLQAGSPCIGMGTLTDSPITDIEGNPRPNPVGSQPDMGAYEYANGQPIITNATGGIVVLPANVALVSFPAGAVSENVGITIKMLAPAAIPPAHGGFQLFGKVYEFTAQNAAGDLVSNFANEVQLTLQYDPTELGGVAEQDLRISYYAEGSGQWVELPSMVDTVQHTVTALTNHFTKFAIFGPVASVPPEPPVDPNNPPVNPPSAVPEPATLFLFGAGLLGMLCFIRKKTRK